MNPGARSAARGPVAALAGALAGYLLWTAYPARLPLTPEASAWVAMNLGPWLAGTMGGEWGPARVLWVANRLLPALPGALLLGIPVGAALRRVAHGRALLYAVLAWPLGKYAYATFMLRAVAGVSEQEQVALWHFRGIAAVDALFIYTPFFVTVYVIFALLARVRLVRPNPSVDLSGPNRKE